MNRAPSLPRYAFFDFDGTLIRQDSFLIMIRAALKDSPWRVVFFIFLSPILAATGLFKLEKSFAKSAVLWSLTVGRGRKNTLHFLRNLLPSLGPKLWIPNVVGALKELQSSGIRIVIVTASGQTWVRGALASQGIKVDKVIGSRLCFWGGGIILQGKNCYGAEKLHRISAALGSEFVWQSCWSDHRADLPLLMKGEQKQIVHPSAKSLKAFLKAFDKDQLTFWK